MAIQKVSGYSGNDPVIKKRVRAGANTKCDCRPRSIVGTDCWEWETRVAR